MTKPSSISISIAHGDALRFKADVLILKHAQALYGVDKAAYLSLTGAGVPIDLPRQGAYRIARSDGAVGAENVLFIGVETLDQFNYGEIREFGRRAMTDLADTSPSPRHIAMTIHGPGYGLDETESFEAELAGLVDAISQNDYPEHLESITFIERDRNRVQRLEVVLRKLLPTGRLDRAGRGPLTGLGVSAKNALRTAGYASAAKPRVFVAMPFADDMSDLFHYGIQGAVNEAGLLAERADLASFTGDVMEWVRARIANANLVVADLTSSNPNVFLEVGYAWGKGVPTLLIAKNTEVLKFDVRGQRCILYSSIKDLQEKLERELVGLRGSA